MKLAFTTLGCPDWTLEEVAAAASQHGYEGVELRLIDGEVITPENIRASRNRLQSLFGPGRPEIVALAAGAHFSMSDPAGQEANQANAREMIELAASLGVPFIRVFGGKRPEGVDVAQGIENVAQGLRAIAGAAETAGVTVMLETHDDFCSSAVVAEIIARVPSRAVGVHWDVQNTYKLGESVEEAWGRLGDRVVHVHVKDAQRTAEPWRRVLLEEGEVPVREAVRLLASRGYRGYLCVEMERKWYPEQPAPEVVLPQYAPKLRAYLAEAAS